MKTRPRVKRKRLSPKQLEVLRQHAIKPGQVLNPAGAGAGKAAHRLFREAFEAAATPEAMARLAKRLLSAALRGKALELTIVVERLWPRLDRLEVGAIGDVDHLEREAARNRLALLIGRREAAPATLRDPRDGGARASGEDQHAGNPAPKGAA